MKLSILCLTLPSGARIMQRYTFMKRQNREWGRGFEERRHHLSFKEKNMRLVDSLKVLNFGTPTNRRLPQHVLLTSEKSFILKEEMTFFRFNPLFTSWFWLFPVLIGASNFKQLVVCVSSACPELASLRSPVRVWHPSPGVCSVSSHHPGWVSSVLCSRPGLSPGYLLLGLRSQLVTGLPALNIMEPRGGLGWKVKNYQRWNL